MGNTGWIMAGLLVWVVSSVAITFQEKHDRFGKEYFRNMSILRVADILFHVPSYIGLIVLVVISGVFILVVVIIPDSKPWDRLLKFLNNPRFRIENKLHDIL